MDEQGLEQRIIGVEAVHRCAPARSMDHVIEGYEVTKVWKDRSA